MAVLKALLFLTFLCIGPSQATTTFTTSSFPFPFYYKSGDQIVLACWVPSDYTFQHWVHPSNEIVSTTNGRYLIQRDPFSVTLRVTNTVASDGGSYTCHALRGAAPHSSSVSAFHADPIMVYSTSVNATVNVGGSYNFSCNATNFLLIQWLYSIDSSRPVVVSNTSDGRVVITKGYELRLTDARFDDEGTYQCRITNNLGRISLTNNLSVIARPEVFVESSFKEVMENSSATLTCTVSGFPLPAIMWRDRSGQVLESSGGVGVSSVAVNSTTVVGSLTFTKVRSSQTGPYTCWGINRHDNSSATINLRLHDTPEPPQTVLLELVKYTNIRVSWTAPHSSVDTYVIMYRVLNGSSAGVFMSLTVLSSAGTTALLTGLDRLTQYSVLVYATNTHGASPNSNRETIATSATVPGQPSAVVVLDVGPSSLRVEWPSSSFPEDDGGATLQHVRITALVVRGGMLIPKVNKTADLEDGFAILLGLEDTTSYQIKVEYANRIGYGAGLLSATFQTPLPGAPGSPIHVVARNVTSSSGLVCWQDSASGQPFLTYKFEVEEAGEDKHLIFRRNADEVKSYPNILGCSKGMLVGELKRESCYRFRVTAVNRVGNGQPSSPSEEVCTLKSSCEGAECTLTKCEGGNTCATGKGLMSGLSVSTLTILAAVVPTVVVVIFIALLVTMLGCASARRAKMRKLEKSGECIPGINRKDSASSSTKLLSIGRSFSGSFSSSSPNHSPEASLEQPGTATTLISNVFEENFSKSSDADFTTQDATPQFNVSVPHGTAPHDQQMYYASDGQQRMLQLPQQGKFGDGFPSSGNIYPIMEDPPSYTHCMSKVGSSNVGATGRAQVKHTEVVMTDNPNYDDRVVPLMTRGQSSNELEHSGSSTPPPVPVYYGGSMTDMQSEAITNRFAHVDTPFFGESYSQAGYSPDQVRKAEPKRNELLKTAATISESNRNPYSPDGASNANGEVNFVDNDAYQTFSAVGHPKFEITGEERGAVREMVQIRKH